MCASTASTASRNSGSVSTVAVSVIGLLLFAGVFAPFDLAAPQALPVSRDHARHLARIRIPGHILGVVPPMVLARLAQVAVQGQAQVPAAVRADAEHAFQVPQHAPVGRGEDRLAVRTVGVQDAAGEVLPPCAGCVLAHAASPVSSLLFMALLDA